MSARQSQWTRREVMRTFSASALGAALPAWVASCGPGAKGAAPPEIAIGQDVCDWCRMTIDDPRLVAAFVPAKGRSPRFGEPGCLLAWLAERPGAEGAAFVAAREDAGWLAGPSARFGRGLIHTPMRFDLAAWRGDPAAPEQPTWAQLLKEGKPHARRG